MILSLILISLVFSFYHDPYIDGIFAILLGIYIAYSALGIGKSAINQLLDKELDEVYVKEIEKIIFNENRSYKKILKCPSQ